MEAADRIGFRTMPVKVPFTKTIEQEPSFLEAALSLYCALESTTFLSWLIKQLKSIIWVADPAQGKFKLPHDSFKKSWISDREKGVALLLEPTPDFYEREGEKDNKKGFTYLFKYLIPYRKLILQLLFGLGLGSLFQLTLPFLTPISCRYRHSEPKHWFYSISFYWGN